jgi:sugar phosphate isomerase/epimerase
MAKRLTETGVVINNADGFALYDDVPMEELRTGIALMAEMGARGIVTLQFDSDAARGFDRFCQLRDWAADASLTLLLEFTPLSRIAGLDDALAYRARAGGDNIALLVDLLHLHRSGGTPASLAAIDSALIRGAQICDGPANATPEEYWDQALHERMIPGEGKLPVQAFLAALPVDLVVGLEVPLRSREQAGEDHLARAQLLIEATRRLLGEADVA